MSSNKSFVLLIAVLAGLAASPPAAEAQLLRNIANLFTAPFRGGGGGGGGFNIFAPRGRFRDDGTQRPVATGRDQINPDDCGRNTNTGRGKLCFPDGKLCQDSKKTIILISLCTLAGRDIMIML